MAHLNELIPAIRIALDKVNRGMPGMMSSVYRDSSAEGVAIGQEIIFPVSAEKKLRDVVPGQNIPAYEGDDVGNRKLKITKQKACDIKWTGNELLEMANLQPNILADEFSQCFETLMSAIEQDMCLTAVAGGLEGGNIIGEAGTEPFTQDLKLFTQTYKVMEDNKVPLNDLKYVLNTTASMNLRNLPQLQKLNESAGSLLRESEIGRLFKYDVAETNEIKKHTKGAGTGYFVNAEAGVEAGTKLIPIDSGHGTIAKGDIVSFGNGNKYVVAKDCTTVGTLELVTPIKERLENDTAVTVENDYTPCVAFQKNALWLATRSIPNPKGGDAAKDIYYATDPVSGLTFMISEYGEYHQMRVEVAIAWGTGIVKPQNIVTLLG